MRAAPRRSLRRTTIRDILMALSDRPLAMSYTTVHMLLTRIVEKGYLAVEQIRGVNYYTPAADRESIVRLAGRRLRRQHPRRVGH